MVIGITGFKGSGKSTVAKYLQENHGFIRINFKDALIREMKLHLPNILEELSDYYSMAIDDLFDAKPPMMRALMLDFGTELRRREDPEHWTKQYKAAIKSTKGNIVTDDVRFNNELDTLKELDGVLIRVKREDIVTGGTHQSETEQMGFIADFTVEGKPGTHVGIFQQTEEIIRTLKNE